MGVYLIVIELIVILCLEIVFLRYSSVCKTLSNVTYVLNFSLDNISVFHFSFIFWVKRLRAPLIFNASRVSNSFNLFIDRRMLFMSEDQFFTHIDLSHSAIFFVNLVWFIRINLFQNLILHKCRLYLGVIQFTSPWRPANGASLCTPKK